MIYLHRPELDELLHRVAVLAEDPDDCPAYVERRGICVEAVVAIADECGAEAVARHGTNDLDAVGDDLATVTANVYICGFLLGLLAAERVGR